jgi:hypothetical protein
MSLLLLHPVTNVLLFDKEPLSTIRPIVDSTECFRDYLVNEYFEESHELLGLKYKAVLAVPASRTDLVPYLAYIESQMEERGVALVVSTVKPEDMMYGGGKLDLLACSLWLVAGAIILNDHPFTGTIASTLYKTAQRLQNGAMRIALQKTGWLRYQPHYCVLRDEAATYVGIANRELSGLLVRHERQLFSG